MNYKCILFIVLALISLPLSACQQQIPTDISVSDNPGDTSNRPAPDSSDPFITIFPQEVSLFTTPQGGEGNFRLLVVVADDHGNSGGLFCPGTNTIPIHNGDTINPCQTGISIQTSKPQDRIYVLIVGVNEKSENELIDIGAGVLGSLLARGVLRAIEATAVSTGPTGFVVGLAIETIIGFAGGKAADWAQQNEILGSQTYVLERNKNWYAGRILDSDSQEPGLHFSFLVDISDQAKGEVVQNENSGPGQPSQPTSTPRVIRPTAEPEVQRPDPVETLYAYYDSLNSGDYRGAWGMLSEHFIQKNNSSGYGDYEDWFKTIRETRINRLNTEYQSDDNASYQLELSYYYQDGRVDTCDIIRIMMIYDTNQNRWLLDDWSLIDGSCRSSS